MTDDQANVDLVFNGIDGESGNYGLEPMTGEKLATLIRAGSKDDSKQRDALERQLLQNAATKIIDIVKFLVESNFQKVDRDAAWQDDWRSDLARLLAGEVLGLQVTDEKEDKEEIEQQVQRLEHRLRGHTREKVVTIVKFLAEAKSKELASLLLVDQDEAPDIKLELEAKLVAAATDQLFNIKQALLDKSKAETMEGDVTAQRIWLEDLVTSLRVVPIKALNDLKDISIQTRDPLITELGALAPESAAPLPWLDALRLSLGELPKPRSWHKLLDKLCEGLLTPIEDQDSSIPWADLFTVLGQWLSSLRPRADLGLIEGLDPKKLEDAGWGIIFPYQEPGATPSVEQIKAALKPLLDCRQSKAAPYFKIYEGPAGYRPKDTARTWLGRKPRYARAEDPADPKKVPYYLLIVGSPEEIPFHFQYQLDVQYAVGRIDFGADLEAYANYARNVVAAETEEAALPRKVTFFGVSNPGDQATNLSATRLVKPLQEQIRDRYALPEWQIDTIEPRDARKANLKRLLEKDHPSLLFAACHGMEFSKKAPQNQQSRYQGALLCQDWDGPAVDRGQVPRDYYLAGEDLSAGADLQGLIAFFFACYSAGTPPFNEFTQQDFKKDWETIADPPFVAALPKAMLGLPKGALAVIGHVERAWGFSYLGDRETEQIAVFQSAVERLLKGHPVGSAMEYFDMRYAALSTQLTSVRETERFGMKIDDYELAKMWTANNDARGYVVIGDPAVRLPGTQTD